MACCSMVAEWLAQQRASHCAISLAADPTRPMPSLLQEAPLCSEPLLVHRHRIVRRPLDGGQLGWVGPACKRWPWVAVHAAWRSNNGARQLPK